MRPTVNRTLTTLAVVVAAGGGFLAATAVSPATAAPTAAPKPVPTATATAAPETLAKPLNSVATDDGALYLPPCAEEDSHNCYWNAKVAGNGHGESFLDWHGQTVYNDGPTHLPTSKLGEAYPGDVWTHDGWTDLVGDVIVCTDGLVVETNPVGKTGTEAHCA
jgi:hypothetical protein